MRSCDTTATHRLAQHFHDGLRSRGYFEGRNVTIEYRWAEGNLDRLPELASQLVHQQVEVILAGGSTGAQVAKEATSSRASSMHLIKWLNQPSAVGSLLGELPGQTIRTI